ncbi:efflux RND transporter periplasmic adaptor subunit [Halioxenophilus aromaticivorans]|uniref:CzcB-like barrel-sandwich hybrid domain-containing protein n=1 Tax=Halioxenophilus aromaticivorans TaxID=1306992 RepID=A0AAV3U547_9ALTE
MRPMRLDVRLFTLASGLFASVGSLSAEQIPPMDCIISPFRSVELASPVPGVLHSIAVDESAFVRRGEITASLESDVEMASVALAKARSEVSSEVEVNNVNYDYDRKRKKRIDTLYDKKSVSFDTKDQADREFSLSKFRLQQAKDLVEIRSLELVRAQAQLAQKTIRSPIDGFVVEHYKEPGEYVEDQAIMRIAQLDPLRVETVVPVEHLAQLQTGQSAQIHPETSNANPVVATVTTIDRVADVASGTIAVQLTLPNPDYSVLAGVKCVMEFDQTPAPRVTTR